MLLVVKDVKSSGFSNTPNCKKCLASKEISPFAAR